MNIFKELKTDLKKKCLGICNDPDIWKKVTLEVPKDSLKNGDIATNIAMLVAAKTRQNPIDLAIKFKELLISIPYVSCIKIGKPAFLNFKIRKEKWFSYIKSILNNEKKFWKVNIGKGKKVNIEYVSANPTGPVHIGHARGAIYGDVLANILKECGYKITREYYINDAGSQIDILIESLLIRYKEIITGKSLIIPEGLYPGKYLIKIAKKLVIDYESKLLDMDKTLLYRTIKKVIVSEMLRVIKLDLKKIGIKHDVFTSEQSLHDNGKIDEAVKILSKMGLIYYGSLPPPKGKIDKNWQEKKQLLFKSSNYGDDQDRPIQKTDGSWSYLAADFAYAKDKIDRGFDQLIYILGADHSGYVKRIKTVIDVFSQGRVKSDIHTSQLVNFVKGGKIMKMSKRSGNFMTINEIVKEINKDIIRFIMLTRRNDIVLDFDFTKAKEQSKDNPVFYVQYAHVRANSILTKARENIFLAYKIFLNKEFNTSLLVLEEEIQLIKLLASWPYILSLSAITHEPQKIVYYLIEIAFKFHSIWNLGKNCNNYRFNIEHNIELTAARLALVESTRKIIFTGLNLIGVKPMKKM